MCVSGAMTFAGKVAITALTALMSMTLLGCGGAKCDMDAMSKATQTYGGSSVACAMQTDPAKSKTCTCDAFAAYFKALTDNTGGCSGDQKKVYDLAAAGMKTAQTAAGCTTTAAAQDAAPSAGEVLAKIEETAGAPTVDMV